MFQRLGMRLPLGASSGVLLAVEIQRAHGLSGTTAKGSGMLPKPKETQAECSSKTHTHMHPRTCAHTDTHMHSHIHTCIHPYTHIYIMKT